MISRIRKALGGSPSDHGHLGAVENKAAGQPPKPIDILGEAAKDLCPDVWLANRLNLSMETVGGVQRLVATPAEMVPYLKAAYHVKKAELPDEMAALVDKISG